MAQVFSNVVLVGHGASGSHESFNNVRGRDRVYRGRGRGRGRYVQGNRHLRQLCGKPGLVALNCWHKYDGPLSPHNSRSRTNEPQGDKETKG